MECPSDIGKALDGLKGVNYHKFNRDDESFNVQFDPDILTIDKILNTITLAGPFSGVNLIYE